MVKFSSETIQLGIRLDKKLIEELDKLAKELGFDRNFLIKKIISEEVKEIKKDLREKANNDYLDLRISRDEYKKILGEYPEEDICNARKELMKGIIENKKGGIDK